jgi:hypothetical protein
MFPKCCGSVQLRGFLQPGSIISSHLLPTLLELNVDGTWGEIFAASPITLQFQWKSFPNEPIPTSVSNGSKFPGLFPARFRPGTELLQRVLPHGNLDRCTLAGFSSKTRHFNITTLAPIMYLISDRIVTWSVCRMCSCSRSFTSRFPHCDPTNIRWVTIGNLLISSKMGLYFTATQRISVGSHIWQREVKERLELHNLRTDHLVIRSELKYLIGVKITGIVKIEPWSGYNAAKNRGFMSGPDNNRAKTARFGFAGGS